MSKKTKYSSYNSQKRIHTALIASAAVSNCTVPKPLDLLSESKLISARITLPAKNHQQLTVRKKKLT